MIIIVSPSRPNCPRPDDFLLSDCRCHILDYLTASTCVIVIPIHHPDNLDLCHLPDTSAAFGISAEWSSGKMACKCPVVNMRACVRACCCIMFVFSCIIKTRSKRKKPTVLNIMHEAVNACVHLCVWVWLFCLLCCASSEATKPHCSR